MYDNIHNFEFGDDFLDIAPKTQTMKEVIYKLYFIKTMWTELKASYILGENICKRQISGQMTKKKKGQLFKIHTQKKKTLQEENQQLDLKNK